jgi:hypothetical protein
MRDMTRYGVCSSTVCCACEMIWYTALEARARLLALLRAFRKVGVKPI